jgi:hypothetical protein
VTLASSKATYSAVVVDYTPPAAATDFFILPGVTGKKISLVSINASGSATTAAYQGLYLYKRTTPNTPGTTTPTFIAKYDSLDPTSSSVPTQALTNPSVLGSGIIMRSDHLALPATAAVGAAELIWNWGNRACKMPVLNNASEFFALSMLGFAVATGANLHITVEWTEE